jgi:hypothetical protein
VVANEVVKKSGVYKIRSRKTFESSLYEAFLVHTLRLEDPYRLGNFAVGHVTSNRELSLVIEIVDKYFRENYVSMLWLCQNI